MRRMSVGLLKKPAKTLNAKSKANGKVESIFDHPAFVHASDEGELLMTGTC